jgi:hypothetical protein
MATWHKRKIDMDDSYNDALDSYNEIEMHEIDELWNLSEDFSVIDAAALVAGYNPVMLQRCRNDTYFDRVFSRYPVAMEGLCKAVTNGRIRASIRHSAREYGYVDRLADTDHAEITSWVLEPGTTKTDDEIMANDQSCFFKTHPDWNLTTVSRDDLVAWLASRGVRTGFFFPNVKPSDEPDFLSRDNDRYAPKLAAAVRAWQAVTDPGKKSPKQALEKWIREHAAEFGLTDDDGNPVNQAIEECSKVANWQQSGGAPKS